MTTVSADPHGDPLDSSVDDAPFVPGYEPVSNLGSGTYGQVWLYREIHSRRRVAIKFLKKRKSQQWQILQAEVKQLAMLDGDPGIVQLKTVELDTEPPYYVMTYAEGGSLVNLLSSGALPFEEALYLFDRITQALAYVHAKGVKHCDLKPGNILLDAVNRPLIADFGQAHIEGEVAPTLGTFFYMAPEQADLNDATPQSRWDTYSLGALFYAMLVGRAPRWDHEIRQRLATTRKLPERLKLYREGVHSVKRLHEHRRVKGVDRRLAEVIDRCLELDPEKRFQDAGEVLEALNRWKHRRQHSYSALLVIFPAVLLLLVTVGCHWLLADAANRVEAIGQMDSSGRSEALSHLANQMKDRLHLVDLAFLLIWMVMLFVLWRWLASRRAKPYKRENSTTET